MVTEQRGIVFQKVLWGSSTSGPQSEGSVAGDGKGWNNWDYWYSQEPELFHQQIGLEQTSTFMNISSQIWICWWKQVIVFFAPLYSGHV